MTARHYLSTVDGKAGFGIIRVQFYQRILDRIDE